MPNNQPFPEPRAIPSLFAENEEFTYSDLSTGAVVCVVGECNSAHGTFAILELKFEFDEAIIAAVKGFNGATWYPDRKVWQIILTPAQCSSIIAFLRRSRFTMKQDVVDALRSNWEAEANING